MRYDYNYFTAAIDFLSQFHGKKVKISLIPDIEVSVYSDWPNIIQMS
jgi:hypothetical protein